MNIYMYIYNAEKREYRDIETLSEKKIPLHKYESLINSDLLLEILDLHCIRFSKTLLILILIGISIDLFLQ